MLAGVALYALIILEGPWGVHSVMQKHRKIRELEQRIAVLAQSNQRLRTYNDRLRTNPDQQEQVIREKLKLNRKGETTFHIHDSPASGSTNTKK